MTVLRELHWLGISLLSLMKTLPPIGAGLLAYTSRVGYSDSLK
jgi:hypothetical protein